MRRFACIILSLIMILSAAVCFTGCEDNSHPTLIIELDPDASSGMGGTVKIELYPEWSPNSVNFIISQVQSGIYEGLPAFRCMAESMIAFGDAWNMKKIDTVIDGEFSANDYEGPDISFTEGVVGMWYYEEAYDSCYGSFFVSLSDDMAEYFDGKYAPVGRVTEGIEYLKDASMVSSSEYMKYEPIRTIKIKEATILLHGKTYDLPVTKKRTDYPGTETE